MNRWDYLGLRHPEEVLPDGRSLNEKNWDEYYVEKCLTKSKLDVSGIDADWEYLDFDKDIPVSESIAEFPEHIGFKIIEIKIKISAKGDLKVGCLKTCWCGGKYTQRKKVSLTLNVDAEKTVTVPVGVTPTTYLKAIKYSIAAATTTDAILDALDIKKKADKACTDALE